MANLVYKVMEREGSRVLHQPIHWREAAPAPGMARAGGHQGLCVEASGLRLAAGNPDGDRWPSWGERGLKIDTGLAGRWRVSAESMGPGAEGSLLAEVGGLARGPELVLRQRARSGEEPGGQGQELGQGTRKSCKHFYLFTYLFFNINLFILIGG